MLAAKVKRKEKSIRIWSAACASGPEPYSLAMLADEISGSHTGNIDFRIFATDNNLPELSKAGMGIFPAISMTKVTLKRAQSYFTRDGEQYTISPHLKGMVDFSYFDLLSDSRSCPEPSIYGNFDLVMCSNLLFYYQPELRLKILGKVEATMTPGAFLVTGETERDLLLKNGYQEVIEYSAIFRKRY
jgi:chemotaxis methyl-accepting protein methylase